MRSPRPTPRALLPAALFALFGGACECGEEIPLIPVTAGSCEPTFECAAGLEYRRGECRASRCQIDDDCCPGQKCNAAAGFCADQYVACTSDAQCVEIPGQACIEFRGGQFCGYPNRGNALSVAGTQACVSDADCDVGRTCFGRRCVLSAPCEGGCPDGQTCDLDSNTCFDDPSCTAACAAGEMRVVEDPDTQSGPTCCLVECACVTLPSIPLGQYGWYSSVAAGDSMIAVSAYDPVYGDLAVAMYDHSGDLRSVDYVDGYPLDGPIAGNPRGARGGRSEPGPDVGEHTSIAIDSAGVVHVAYYDRGEGRLKYANHAGGVWSTSVVDEDGHVGMYTSIAIGPDGSPSVAYMLVEGMSAPDPTPITGLKYASARTNMPISPADWTIELVDRREKPMPVCGGGCGNGLACVDFGNGPECAPELATCSPCGMGEACVNGGGGPSCLAKVPSVPLDDLIEGTGLFADLVFDPSGRALIAYYDRIDGDLRLATQNPGGGFQLSTLDGADPMSPTDVGQHVSLAVAPTGAAGVAYFDATNDDLVYLDLATGAREVVDDGIVPPDLKVVGADASLAFDPTGAPAIAYQDATQIDLVYARRTGSPPEWWTEILRGDPPPGSNRGKASGFYASQAARGDQAFISSVDVSFDAESNLLLDLELLIKTLE